MTSLPIVERELRVAARRRSTYRIRIAIAAIAIAIGAALMISNSTASAGNVGRPLFWALSGLAILYSFAAGRLSTADCISEEKRDGTIGFLFLTDLKGYDIVLGKVVATSLNGFYGLLAVFPVLAVPLVLGGMTNGEFWRMVVVLISTFLLSISVGVFTSSLSRDFRRALAANFLTLLLVTTVPAAIGGVVYYYTPGHVFIDELFYSCPGYPFYLAVDTHYALQPEDFWWSIGATLFISTSLLAMASRIVPTSWQDKPSVSKAIEQPEAAVVRRPKSVRHPSDVAFRRRLLDVNAYYWLTARNRHKPLQVGMFLAAAGVWWLWVWTTHYSTQIDVIVGITFAMILNTTLKIWIALEAGQRLLEDKRAGALELLLTTPLNGHEILKGQLFALRRQFLWPLILVISVEILMIFVMTRTSVDSQLFWVWLAGLGMLILDVPALIFCSMAAALSGRSLHKANLSTIFRILILPWIAFFVIALGATVWSFLFSVGRYAFTWAFYLPIWFVLGLAFDAFFGWKSLHRLRTRFHELAARQEETSDNWSTASMRDTKSRKGRKAAGTAATAGEPSSSIIAEQTRKGWKKRTTAMAALLVVATAGFLYLYYFEPAAPPPAVVRLANNNGLLKVFPCESSMIIIPPDGSLWHWGRIPQLTETPIRIGTGTNWARATGQSTHWLALQNDGTLWQWGRRWSENLGPLPTQVEDDSDWTKFSTGQSHSVALKKDGTLWAWGSNNHWQLGIGDSPYQPEPIQVGTDSNWSDVYANGSATFGLRKDGTLWVWGNVQTQMRNAYQQIRLPTPTRFNRDTNWTEMMTSNGTTFTPSGLIKNQKGELWTPDGIPGANRFTSENCTRFLPASLTGHFATGLMTKPELSLGIFQVRENGTLWATPRSWDFLRTSTRVDWQQFGERSDWVSVWGKGSTILGQTSDNTLWIWGADLGRAPETDLGARFKQLQAGIMQTFGRPYRGTVSNRSHPIQMRPRPLMKLVTP